MTWHMTNSVFVAKKGVRFSGVIKSAAQRTSGSDGGIFYYASGMFEHIVYASDYADQNLSWCVAEGL